LWKLPVTVDLAANVTCGPEGDPGHRVASPGVSCSYLSELDLPGYNHFGDLDYYEFNGRGYLLVPLEGDGSVDNGLLIFRAADDPGTSADENLQLLAFAPIPEQASSSWVAVDRNGILYSSEFITGGVVNRFRLDWASYQADERTPPVLERLEPLLLLGEDGAVLDFPHAQGAEFSDDGRLFYMVNGRGKGNTDPRHGIHVFQIGSASGQECDPVGGACLVARRIERSHNSDDPGFAFEFHPGVNDLSTAQEPEGLTFWDLDADDRAPGMRGQLHVVLLDNNLTAEEVFVKHYAYADIDSAPPAISCPAPVTVECTSPAGALPGDAKLSAFLSGVSSVDSCTPHPRIDHNAPPAFPLGTTSVEFTATDDAGNAASCQAAVTVVDTTAPAISVTLSHDTLWPPNHGLVPITANVTVNDACGAARFELVTISSNEPDDATGDGDTSRDIQEAVFGTADTGFLLRAERSGSGDGRQYAVVYRVIDGSGNESLATAVVRVPASQ
jgi:hypothetical protein